MTWLDLYKVICTHFGHKWGQFGAASLAFVLREIRGLISDKLIPNVADKDTLTAMLSKELQELLGRLPASTPTFVTSVLQHVISALISEGIDFLWEAVDTSIKTKQAPRLASGPPQSTMHGEALAAIANMTHR